MVRLLHAADLHIGKSRDFPSYLDRQGKMCECIFETAKDKTDGIVLISGDVYDNSVLRPREKDLFIEKLSKADQDGVFTVIINGNHDIIDQMDNGYTHLRTIKSLIDCRRLKNTVCVEFTPTAFYAEKFKIGIVAVPALYRKTKEVNAIVSRFAAKLRKAYGNIEIVAMVHETILGSVNDTGFVFDKGVSLSDAPPITYWALGDIHAFQQIPGTPNAFYSGCPIQHDFSDSSKRGVLLVDTSDPENPEFYPMYHKVPKLVTISLSSDQDTSTIDLPSNDLVRIEATRQQLAEMYLPANVVRTKISNVVMPLEVVKQVGLDDMFDGLVEILSELGLDTEGQEFCLDITRKLQ